jgi:murein DD-endopeptidase MepM/ murein hydrolase activator NlpD
LTIQVFPVDETAEPKFSPSFGAPRSGGRAHQGTDIFAPEGTRVLAVDVGDARRSVEARGGNVVYLKARDGWQYFYAHLQAHAEGVWPRKVRPGDVLGYLGSTGNADANAPHLHFEARPPSSYPVDPYPLLRRLGTELRDAASSSWGAGVMFFLALMIFGKRRRD